AVVQHQAEAVGLIPRTLLGAVGYVAAVGRVERGRVARRVVGRNVLGLCQNLGGRGGRPHMARADIVRAPTYRNDPQIVVGGGGRVLVVIRGVANLLAVGGEGVVVLTAYGENWGIEVAGSEIERSRVGTAALGFASLGSRGGCPHTLIYGDHEEMGALAFSVGIPVTIEEVVEDLGLHLGVFGFFQPFRVAGLFGFRRAVAFRVDIGLEENVLAIGRPQFSGGFCGDRSQLVCAGDLSRCAVEVGDPDLRSLFFRRDESEALAIR